VIGPANSGKTEVGRRLAAVWDADFLEGDQRHSPANKAKMRSGVGLDDADRAPWLAALRDDLLRGVQAGRKTVLSCSALKRRYRDLLACDPRVRFLYPRVPADTLVDRALARTHEYIDPAKMGVAGLRTWLQGQLSSFEPLAADEPALELDGRLPPDELAAATLAHMAAAWPEDGHDA
jgi:gluconokinase